MLGAEGLCLSFAACDGFMEPFEGFIRYNVCAERGG